VSEQREETGEETSVIWKDSVWKGPC